MELPLSLKPSRFQIALLLALLPIFVLGDRVANFTRGGTIQLTVSRDQRFVAIHHVDWSWFDRFRILDRENGRLVATPKRSFLWNEGEYLKEIDGKWFLAISYSTLHEDRCWVQRIDKNTLAWEKPRWIPGDPVAWGNGKILCRFQGNFTIVDENDSSQKQELPGYSPLLNSLCYQNSFVQTDSLISLALKEKFFNLNPSGSIISSHANDEEITLLILRRIDSSKKLRLVLEKIGISTGERTLSYVLPIEDFSSSWSRSRVINDGRNVSVFSSAGLQLFDTQSQEIRFITKDFDGYRFTEISRDPWIVMNKGRGFYFLNTKTLMQSWFPIRLGNWNFATLKAMHSCIPTVNIAMGLFFERYL